MPRVGVTLQARQRRLPSPTLHCTSTLSPGPGGRLCSSGKAAAPLSPAPRSTSGTSAESRGGGEAGGATGTGGAEKAAAAEHARHPAFAELSAVWSVELGPGDVLYTPPFWWHHVRTHDDGPALSVLVPFDPEADEAPHPCHYF